MSSTMTDARQTDDNLIPAGVRERISTYHEAGADWLERLPELVARCVSTWDLVVLPAFEPGGDSSWVAPVRRGQGDLAVLKITVPTAVRDDPATPLGIWAGRGAVRLYAHDTSIGASLLEYCVPGTDAADLPRDAADDVAVEVLEQLWQADLPSDAPIEPLTNICALRIRALERRADQYAGDTEDVGGQVDVGPFREAARLFASLPGSTDRQVLLHGDFHRRNVISSARGWLAIDPVGRRGDPGFDVAAFLQHDANRPDLRARADGLADRLGLDAERTRHWLFAFVTQAASWHLSIGDYATYATFSQGASTLT
ncbi:aminoglycoside phosphotransferase family protein [Actinopolymorpha pittospori]|uniref:Streptomycin 6-kinase n=1 Tax=Actinopolymorpha pittospori TaxID=648752 RepID=A0A927RQ97_9ACTN|nr:streptomycin 6-kinase [Actinopolymorpha pittospori]